MKTFIDRFLQLFLLGLLVNFFQQLVPMLLEPEVFGKAQENLYTIIAVDIYQFASLATLYFAIMQKLNRNTKSAMVFSILLLSFCMILNATLGCETFTTGNNWYDTLIGFFVRENEYSYFPFISWILFPISGYGAAFLYQKLDGKKNLLSCCFVTGIGLILLSELLMNIFSIRDVIIHFFDQRCHHSPCIPGGRGILCDASCVRNWGDRDHSDGVCAGIVCFEDPQETAARFLFICRSKCHVYLCHSMDHDRLAKPCIERYYTAWRQHAVFAWCFDHCLYSGQMLQNYTREVT